MKKNLSANLPIITTNKKNRIENRLLDFGRSTMKSVPFDSPMWHWCDYLKRIFTVASLRVLPSCPLISSQASWKVEITLSHQEKLAASPLEFFPVEVADWLRALKAGSAGRIGKQGVPVSHTSWMTEQDRSWRWLLEGVRGGASPKPDTLEKTQVRKAQGHSWCPASFYLV